MSLSEDQVFEKEVRRVANALWPGRQHGTAVLITGLERDGLFETEECLHLVECTTSRSQQKAREDVKKLDQGADELRKQHPDKGIKTWFVTRHEATPDQAKEAKLSKSGVTIIPFSAFQAKLIDVGTYLECRCNHRFGSIDHPLGLDSSKIHYIDIPILSRKGNETWSVAKIANSLTAGERFTLLGDYGIGKSMTLREVFRYLRKRYLEKHFTCFPLHLNLREHHGQSDPAEIIERHARNIGYPNPSHLVRAWRAGYAILLLDGFDEVASFGLQGAWKKLRQARWQTVAGIRKLIEQSPVQTGISVAGRHSFFDSDRERNESLKDGNFQELLLHEFTETQIGNFFKEVGYKGSVPSWLPARPLLLSTVFWLYSNKNKNTVSDLNLPDDPQTGWSLLLEAISERESKIEAGVSGSIIQRLLEILATKARTTSSGLGPLTAMDITSAFTELTGSQPSSEALGVLQRLPGLGIVPNSDDGLRTFLDEDFVDALGASDVFNSLIDPYSVAEDSEVFRVAKTLGEVGTGILHHRLSNKGFERKRCIQTARELERKGKLKGIFGDLVGFAIALGFAQDFAIEVQDIEFSNFEMRPNMGNISGLRFKSCVFRRLIVSSEADRDELPTFSDCLVEFLEGFLSPTDMPADKFIGCEIESFVDMAETNTAIARSDLPAQIRVLITILRKLFVQSLGGRQIGALRRGLDLTEQQLVDEVVKALLKNNMATQYKADTGVVVVPIRRQRHRALAMIASPLGCNDPLIEEIRTKD